MAKSRAREADEAPAERSIGSYFEWSRQPAMGLFAVVPLWLLYMLLRWQLAPDERNGAEDLLLQQLHRFGPRAHLAVSFGFAMLTVAAAMSLVRRHVPWLRVAAVIALEGLVYGVMLGPIASVLTSSANQILAVRAPAVPPGLLADLVGSIGAGIFEELVFRLGLMSLLAYVGLRAVQSWSLPRWLAGLFAVLVSALVFSWFHHLCGEPFDRGRFVFRTMAGVLLGVLMWLRGYGVCVYTHTAYDVYFYLRP